MPIILFHIGLITSHTKVMQESIYSSVNFTELTDCLLNPARVDQNPTLQITSVGDRNVAGTYRANATFEATIHAEYLVFTGKEACVGRRVFTSHTWNGQL